VIAASMTNNLTL